MEYGWNSTVFTTVENFWIERGFMIPALDAGERYAKIQEQILQAESHGSGKKHLEVHHGGRI